MSDEPTPAVPAPADLSGVPPPSSAAPSPAAWTAPPGSAPPGYPPANAYPPGHAYPPGYAYPPAHAYPPAYAYPPGPVYPPGYAYPPAYPPGYAYSTAPEERPLGPAPGLRYCGFWMRVGALLIDTALSVGLGTSLGLAAWGATSALPADGGPALIAIAVIVGVLSWLWLQIGMVGRFGGTVGMRLLGMRVVREADGSQAGYALAAGRFGVYIALGIVPYLGFLVQLANAIVCGVDARKQAIHDKACSTLVVRRG